MHEVGGVPPNAWRELPAAFASTTQFYPRQNKQKSRRVPRAEDGSDLTQGQAFFLTPDSLPAKRPAASSF